MAALTDTTQGCRSQYSVNRVSYDVPEFNFSIVDDKKMPCRPQDYVRDATKN